MQYKMEQAAARILTGSIHRSKSHSLAFYVGDGTADDISEQHPGGPMQIHVNLPQQVRVGQIIYPPLVVNADVEVYDWIQVMLVDAFGNVDTALAGDLARSLHPLNDNQSGSSQPTGYAVFPNLSVGLVGTFTIKVCGMQMNYTSSSPDATVATEVYTGEISVREEAVAAEKPSNDERRLLRRLRDHSSRFGVPRSPASS
ncbi:hypothetical protein JX266_009314 [Neoarthrinium moseri]|nr:hypothetical protein JX266_009314 [Neoarthrinium moseri]